MTAPNLFLVYVRDVERSTAFYRELLGIEPVFTSPRYVAFEAAPGMLFALWSGRPEAAVPGTPRTSEVGLMVTGGPAEVDAIHAAWAAKGVEVLEPPHDEVFGRTFVIADPDGNLVRVSPVD
ncbi:glyoxalase [Pseudoclavibacter chungangensis]|uniref:Glyoxalase n=1 Tax=Pseudoclavibacter chungangensis TaxID=587635 RepID=A0A7J5C0R4_9MICO|nr:VOC family protein [Pseudoclavibacter chungangensis]KAB1659400.1 glyoxalase [Pseudoclavibacter chungangensis]NYJ67759.1 catechol 2,3-dioxygenase-like lactoylglutathione lyase family enzyme [Pseudoclavibacter chungangensis]